MRYFLLGLFRKPQRAQRHAEKNNTSLRLSASSAVNFFCHDLFIRNKLKSHVNEDEVVKGYVLRKYIMYLITSGTYKYKNIYNVCIISASVIQ